MRGSHRVLIGAAAVAFLAIFLPLLDGPAAAQGGDPGVEARLDVSPRNGNITTNFLGDATRSRGSLVDGGPQRSAIVLYEWDWNGTGEYVEGRSRTFHTYDAEGTYPVSVRVTDETGAVGVAFRNVTVGEPRTGFRWEVVTNNLDDFWRGAQITLFVSSVSIVAGLPLGIVFGLLRIANLAPVRWAAGAYIEFLRGTPLLVQIFIIVFGLPELGITLGPIRGGIVALTINTSAYQAEIIRAGIASIPSGQMEAALAMGLSYPQSMRFVILPQALRLVIPPLTNEFIILIKDSALISLIGVLELMGYARVIGQRSFRLFEPFLAAALMYFVMTYSLSLFLQWVERKLAIPGLGLGGTTGQH